MTRADRALMQRHLHTARVEAYAIALFDTGPKPANNEQEQRWRQMYRADAERRVSDYERHGLLTTDIERVA